MTRKNHPKNNELHIDMSVMFMVCECGFKAKI